MDKQSVSDILVFQHNNLKKRHRPQLLNDNHNYCADLVVRLGLGLGFHHPYPPQDYNNKMSSKNCSRHFWKAGDNYDPNHSPPSSSSGMDHARVHPNFLHSNATIHKWALGAFAELLDNALDELSNGATYVNVDVVMNRKDHQTMAMHDKDRFKMLLLQDNGGGMSPDKIRNCMSFGYSEKPKIANTIGQYGNGFKTSTMRLGADVIVFSLCKAKGALSATRSIGMLSYTFLKSTKMQDTFVPMLDYEMKGDVWTRTIRSSLLDWHLNLDTITEWSPFSSEQELLQQFDYIDYQGTRIMIYNLWEDDEKQLELDFDTDPHDIQIRGVNRDDKKIAMARKYPNSKHFLTYQHSLRSYASILYLKLPRGFRIIMRGKHVEHHNLANDMLQPKEVQYRPLAITDGTVKDSIVPKNTQVSVTLGFAKGAEGHIDIHGFNVYHKNRLIKPFWRVWNPAGSDGRGVIGQLEVDFVEPAHDKQGFERTTALSRLEHRLITLQKKYWNENCHIIGYAPRRVMNKKALRLALPLPSNSNSPNVKGHNHDSSEDDIRSPHLTLPSVQHTHSSTKFARPGANGNLQGTQSAKSNARLNTSQLVNKNRKLNTSNLEMIDNVRKSPDIQAKITVARLKKENLDLKKRLEEDDDDVLKRSNDLQQQLEFEREKCKLLEAELEDVKGKNAAMNKEQDIMIDIFVKDTERRDTEEENLRKSFRNASRMIGKLLEKLKESERKML